jgi:hypothetical protein
MNLHNIVTNVISSVNPMMLATIKHSDGYTTADDGTRTPAYTITPNVRVQRQALSEDDLRQIEGLNIQGEMCSMYINGSIRAVSRTDGTGGDLITLSDSTIWLATRILENWDPTSGWTKVLGVRQLS